jgi:HAD superfamily hydrolase (TIGR01509 family)
MNNPKANRIPIFIFDLDGTILDDLQPMIDVFTKDVPQHFGKQFNEVMYQEMERRTMDLIAGKGSRRYVIKLLWWYANQLGFKKFREKKALAQYLRVRFDEIIPNFSLFPGTLEALQSLKQQGFRLALNTSSSRHEVELKFQARPEFLALFGDLVISRSDVKHIKPAPDSILEIARRCQVSPQDCLMIGDMPIDINCGKNAGAKTALVLCGFLTPERIQHFHIEADFEFTNVADLVAHLNDILIQFE